MRENRKCSNISKYIYVIYQNIKKFKLFFKWTKIPLNLIEVLYKCRLFDLNIIFVLFEAEDIFKKNPSCYDGLLMLPSFK